LRTIQKYRPLELERAIKNQPEFTLDFWRLLMHTYALMHIHRVLASGMRVEGWCFNKHNYVTREDGSGNGLGIDVLSLRKVDELTVYWVIPLDQPLIFPNPRLIFNVDEKPLIPDSPL
jgi:hypothetical protein